MQSIEKSILRQEQLRRGTAPQELVRIGVQGVARSFWSRGKFAGARRGSRATVQPEREAARRLAISPNVGTGGGSFVGR